MTKKIVYRLSVVLGIIIFLFLVYQIGPMKIWETIKKISPINFVILMVVRFFYWVLRTIAWKVVLDSYGEKQSLWHLYKIRMCSHSVSQFTPSAQVGGEAVRIFMTDCSNRKLNLASVVVDKTIEIINAFLFSITGVALVITQIPIPSRLKIFFIGIIVLFSILLIFFVSKQQKGLFGWILDLLAKVRIRLKFLEKNQEKMRETDEYISDFYQKHRRGLMGCFMVYSLLTLLWAAETQLTLVYLGDTSIDFIDSYIITAIGNLALIFPFIPASLGVYETTYIALFALLGKRTHMAFSLVLVRRIIALLWGLIGLTGWIKPRGGGGRRPHPIKKSLVNN